MTNGINLRGLAVGGFSGYAVDVVGNGNTIGCSALGLNGGGIRIAGSNNTLSGLVIGGNTGYGILVTSGTGNLATGNLIGAQPNGTPARNGLGGVKVATGAQLKFGSGNRIRG